MICTPVSVEVKVEASTIPKIYTFTWTNAVFSPKYMIERSSWILSLHDILWNRAPISIHLLLSYRQPFSPSSFSFHHCKGTMPGTTVVEKYERRTSLFSIFTYNYLNLFLYIPYYFYLVYSYVTVLVQTKKRKRTFSDQCNICSTRISGTNCESHSSLRFLSCVIFYCKLFYEYKNKKMISFLDDKFVFRVWNLGEIRLKC